MNSSYTVEEPLRGIISVEFETEDIAQDADKKIDQLRKTIEMPGFRKGKVPKGLIEKKYGEAVRYEVASDKANEEMQRLYKEKEIDSITMPLRKDLAIGEEGKYHIQYIFPLTPDMGVTLDKSIKLPFYTIEATEEDINNSDEHFRMSQATTVEVDKMGEKDSLQGKLEELNEEGEPLEGGLTNEYALIIPYYFRSEEETKKFAGAEKGAKIRFNPMAAYEGNKAMLKGVFNVNVEEDITAHKGDFLFTIEKIEHLEPATLSEEFYKKVFGEETSILDEESYRKEIARNINEQYQAQAKTFFRNQLLSTLLKEAKHPEVDRETIKDILRGSIEEEEKEKQKKLTDEEIDFQVEGFIKYIYSNAVINQLLKSLDITLSKEQIEEQVKKNIIEDLKRYGLGDTPYMHSIADKMLEDRMKDEQYVDSAIGILKETLIAEKAYDLISREDKQVQSKEFYEIVSEFEKSQQPVEEKSEEPSK